MRPAVTAMLRKCVAMMPFCPPISTIASTSSQVLRWLLGDAKRRWPVLRHWAKAAYLVSIYSVPQSGRQYLDRI